MTQTTATFDLDNTYPTTPAAIRQGDTVCALFGEDFEGVVDRKERNGQMVLLTLVDGTERLSEANEEFIALI
jgi:hypothetical protein